MFMGMCSSQNLTYNVDDTSSVWPMCMLLKTNSERKKSDHLSNAFV